MSRDDVDHVNGDAEHGRAGQKSTNEMTPPRIVVVEVFQFLKFDDVEEEDALMSGRHRGWLVCTWLVLVLALITSAATRILYLQRR